MTFFYSADDLVEKVFLFCCIFIDVGVGVGCCLSNTITVVSSYQKVAITLKAKKRMNCHRRSTGIIRIYRHVCIYMHIHMCVYIRVLCEV